LIVLIEKIKKNRDRGILSQNLGQNQKFPRAFVSMSHCACELMALDDYENSDFLLDILPQHLVFIIPFAP